MPRPEYKGDNVEETRIWSSICHIHALNALLISGNELEDADARRIRELGKCIIEVLKDPALVAYYAIYIVKGTAKMIAAFAKEDELRRESVAYLKKLLKRVKDMENQPSSAEEFERQYGSWLMQVMDSFLAVQALSGEEAEKRVAGIDMFVNTALLSPLELAHLGLALHKWSFKRLFHSLPIETYSPSSVTDFLKNLLALEAKYHPELGEVLEILD
jgi:hypothetical protein